MTRINVVPVQELADEQLKAEYRELPRVIKGDFNLKDAPDFYCLGKGHVKWAKKHSWWILCRYEELCDEMKYRGFQVNYPYENLLNKYYNTIGFGYVVTEDDIKLSRKRLVEKYQLKPSFYHWTNREKPQWFMS